MDIFGAESLGHKSIITWLMDARVLSVSHSSLVDAASGWERQPCYAPSDTSEVHREVGLARKRRRASISIDEGASDEEDQMQVPHPSDIMRFETEFNTADTSRQECDIDSSLETLNFSLPDVGETPSMLSMFSALHCLDEPPG